LTDFARLGVTAEPAAPTDGRRLFGFWDFKLTRAAAAAELQRSASEGFRVGEREWATIALEALTCGRSVQVRPRGHSMRGRIDDGALVTLEPCRPGELVVGDIVLARVRGWLLVLHQIVGIEPGRFQIGTVAGRSDGWVSGAEIFGRVVDVRPAPNE
jgi:hypothetical protein